MKVLLFLLAFLIVPGPEAQSQIRRNDVTLCYFSLNNTKEFTSMKGFADKLNLKNMNGAKINVVEFMKTNGNPEAAFKEMVSSNTNCDALIISGHHTGAWGGKNANGTLKLDFLETMSCDPKHKEWFGKIKALWLQGCRTLGVDKITPIDTADFHAARVGQDRVADGLNQSYSDMNHEFTNTLDQDNPLSSRYLRMFPRATTFGWTRTAPGEKSQSDKSLLFHIAQMAAINDYYKSDVLIDPLSNFSPNRAAELANAVLDIVHKGRDPCERISMDAWKRQGISRKFGFNNADVNAYPSFATTNDSKAMAAKELGCKLKFPTDHNDRIQTLKKILSDKTTIAANYNVLVEYTQKAHGMNEEQRSEVLSLLKNSELLKTFTGNKIVSPNVGIFPKIDYYTFYKKVYNTSSPDMERHINSLVTTYLGRAYPANEDSIEYNELHDYKVTLMDSVVKNNYVSEKFMMDIFNKRTDESNTAFLGIYDKLTVSGLPGQKELAARLKSFTLQLRNY